jgi:hypothetical protein
MPRATVDLHLRFDADISGDLLAALLIREQAQAQAHPAVQRAIEEEDFQRGLPDPADPARVAAPAAAEPAPEPTKPPTAKKRTTTGKPPAGNGAGDGTAPRQQPTEPELRAVLADMASVHPQKVAAVVSLLRTVGGSARLLDCPQDKWLAIEDAARAVLAELRPVS